MSSLTQFGSVKSKLLKRAAAVLIYQSSVTRSRKFPRYKRAFNCLFLAVDNARLVSFRMQNTVNSRWNSLFHFRKLFEFHQDMTYPLRSFRGPISYFTQRGGNFMVLQSISAPNLMLLWGNSLSGKYHNFSGHLFGFPRSSTVELAPR